MVASVQIILCGCNHEVLVVEVSSMLLLDVSVSGLPHKLIGLDSMSRRPKPIFGEQVGS